MKYGQKSIGCSFCSLPSSVQVNFWPFGKIKEEKKKHIADSQRQSRKVTAKARMTRCAFSFSLVPGGSNSIDLGPFNNLVF